MVAVAAAFSMTWAEGGAEGGTGPGAAGRDLALGCLAGFRGELYQCLGKRADALFEACDAVLCRQERVHILAELSLEPECRRGHGAVYDVEKSGSGGRGGPSRRCRCRPGTTAGSVWRAT
jgi:hypothetical protein